MLLFIKRYPHKAIILSVEENDSILSVKEKIQQQIGISLERQILKFLGERFYDLTTLTDSNKTLKEYNIVKEGSSVNLTVQSDLAINNPANVDEGDADDMDLEHTTDVDAVGGTSITPTKWLLYVKNASNGLLFSVSVDRKDTFSQVKQYIQDVTGIMIEHQYLYSEGESLLDTNTVDHQFEFDDVVLVYLIARSLEDISKKTIFVQGPITRIMTLDLSIATTTIAMIKEEIHRCYKLPINILRLYVNNIHLLNDRYLNDYTMIHNDTTLQLVVRDKEGDSFNLQIQTSTGIVLTVQVEDTWTINQLKQQLQSQFFYQYEHQKLYYKSIQLSDNCTLCEYGILRDGDTINMIIRRPRDNVNTIVVFIKSVSGKTTIIETTTDTTILQLKEIYACKERVPIDQQTLICHSKELNHRKTLLESDIHDGTTIHLTLRLRGMISSFVTTQGEGVDTDIFTGFLLGNNPPPTIEQFFDKWINRSFSPYTLISDHRNVLSKSQIRVCKRFMDILWSNQAVEYERRQGVGLTDLKVKFTDNLVASMLLGYRSYGEDDSSHNSDAMRVLLNLHCMQENGARIALRYTRGPVPGAIGWHFDGGYASDTIQVALNDSSEYEGGRLCYFTEEKGVEVLERVSGDITIHNQQVLHAVTRLIKGDRYSLFVVDKSNGLGDQLVVTPTIEMVEEILDRIRAEEIAESCIVYEVNGIPFDALTLDESLLLGGTFGSSVLHSGKWLKRDVSVIECKCDRIVDVDLVNSINTLPLLLHYYGRCEARTNLGTPVYYDVIESVPCGTLHACLQRALSDGMETLKPLVFLEILSQLISAMQCVYHTLHLPAHRSVTLSNVYMVRFDTVNHHMIQAKLGGFSLSRKVPSGEELVSASSAPEVRKRQRYTEASDIWSFGILIWELYSMDKSIEWDNTENDEHDMKVECPLYCPDFVYESMMLPCLKQSMLDRPTFRKLNQVLRKIQEEVLREEGAVESGNHKICCVCLIHRATVAIIPCGHLCLCSTCESRFPYDDSNCPICRGDINDLLTIYE